VIKRGCRE